MCNPPVCISSLRMLSIRSSLLQFTRKKGRDRYAERANKRKRERVSEKERETREKGERDTETATGCECARKGSTTARKKNGNSLKRLFEPAVSLTRRRLVCFSAYVKLNSPGNFTPTARARASYCVSACVLHRILSRVRQKGKERNEEKERRTSASLSSASVVALYRRVSRVTFSESFFFPPICRPTFPALIDCRP